MRVCSKPGCPAIYPTTQGSQCPTHRGEGDRGRGTASERGYTSRGHKQFRKTVLHRDPVCVACHQAIATIADHHPHDRRELIELGLNPNNPDYGRGLCAPCHSKATTANQPGGWNTH